MLVINTLLQLFFSHLFAACIIFYEFQYDLKFLRIYFGLFVKVITERNSTI